jgi:hypothetical protein
LGSASTRRASVELRWQDEARLGQKNPAPRRWARQGSRPAAPKDRRTASAGIFGAVCPAKGEGASLVLFRCARPAMTAHRAEIRRAVDPGAHAVPILEGTGRHVAADLVAPDTIALPTLPSHAPELDPVEKVWQVLRENRLGDRVFASCEDIPDHGCEAWNKLIAQPWTIRSPGLRQWAYRS